MLPGSVFGEWLLCSNESGGALCGDLLFGAVAGRDGRRTEQRGAVVLGSGSRTFGGWAGAMESGATPLEKDKRTYEYATFDQFVKNLSYWSSWSTGMTIWKEDFEKLPEDSGDFNELFPHTNVCFAERNRGKYIIDNTIIFNEMPQGKKPKGEYNLFYAFGVDYPAIILNLYRDKSISAETLKSVLNDNLRFIAYMYSLYYIKKEYCSYDLNGLNDMYGIFYTKQQLKNEVTTLCVRKIVSKIKNIFGKVNK